MKELFLKTENGLVPLDERIIAKYNLKEGRKSPFTRYYVVNKTGAHKFGNEKKDIEMPEGEGMDDDEIIEFSETGAIMSQSEILDFSKGTDSSDADGNYDSFS